MTRVLALWVVAWALSPSLLVAGDDFAGKWVNRNDKTGGLTRLEISKKNKGWTIQAWGAAGGGETDLGEVRLHLLGDTSGDTRMKHGLASWDHKFKEMYLTIRLEKGGLAVEHFNVFKDGSRRSNYRVMEEFKQGK